MSNELFVVRLRRHETDAEILMEGIRGRKCK